MLVVSFITAPFSQAFAKTELKNDLAKGNYESPYIVTKSNFDTNKDQLCLVS